MPEHKHKLAVNTFGDLSDGCKTTGSILRSSRYAVPEGDLGVIKVNKQGSAVFDFLVSGLDLSGEDSIIGRSLVLMSHKSYKSGIRLACGVIGLAK